MSERLLELEKTNIGWRLAEISSSSRAHIETWISIESMTPTSPPNISGLLMLNITPYILKSPPCKL
jgi:hypothetical protein